METLTLFDDTSDTKILRPKARRIIPKRKNINHKGSSNSYKYSIIKDIHNQKEQSKYLEKISLEEIDKDFMKLKANSDEQIFINEIMNIFSLLDIKNEKSYENKKMKKNLKNFQNCTNQIINIIRPHLE